MSGCARGCILTAAVLACGCEQNRDPCFTPQSIVEDLRVLALSVDPPTPIADLATGEVEPVRLRGLFASPNGTAPTRDVSWAVCVPGSEPLCPEDSIVARDHGWQRDSSVEIRVPLDLIAAARTADPLHGAYGIRVLATVRVAGAVPEEASTPILFGLPGQARNHPPIIAGVRLAREGFPFGPTSTAAGVDMFSESPNGLRPVLAPGALEEYDAIDLAGRRVHLRERVLYSFYGTPALYIGRLQHSSTGLAVFYGNGNDSEAEEPPLDAADPPDGLIPLTAMGSGVLWVVARDSRGSVAWLEVPIHVKAEDPRCVRGAFPLFFDCLHGDAIFGCL